MCRRGVGLCVGGGLRVGAKLLAREGHEGVHLRHVHVKGLARLHHNAVARLRVDDHFEGGVQPNVAHVLGHDALLRRRHRLPERVVGHLRRLRLRRVDAHVAEAERDDVLEKVRALRDGHVLVERRLHDDRRGVDVAPRDWDARGAVATAAVNIILNGSVLRRVCACSKFDSMRRVTGFFWPAQTSLAFTPSLSVVAINRRQEMIFLFDTLRRLSISALDT